MAAGDCGLYLLDCELYLIVRFLGFTFDPNAAGDQDEGEVRPARRPRLPGDH